MNRTVFPSTLRGQPPEQESNSGRLHALSSRTGREERAGKGGAIPYIACLGLAVLLSACGRRGVDVTLVTGTLPPAGAAAAPRQPTASMTSTAPWEMATRAGDMEAYGLVFDPQAVPRLPPQYSISMPIWGTALPARSIEGQPRFLASPPPARLADPIALLEKARCQVGPSGDATCQADSPLAAFACEWITVPVGIYPDFGSDQGLVAACTLIPSGEDQPREEYLFRRGCAFRRNVAYVFKAAGDYILIGSPEQLKAFFGPIESPEEALSYAQLLTGLEARFDFENDPGLLYFQESIEGTRVTETGGGYSMNLFHFQICLCEPWINSEIEIMVDRSGEITWLGAVPISMTTGFSCAD
jgi:hypothetical protein